MRRLSGGNTLLMVNTMIKEEQLRIAKDLTEGITRTILTKIEKGNLPEEWDGNEIRQWIVDTFKDHAVIRPMTGKRMKDYRNEVIVRNL